MSIDRRAVATTVRAAVARASASTARRIRRACGLVESLESRHLLCGVGAGHGELDGSLPYRPEVARAATAATAAPVAGQPLTAVPVLSSNPAAAAKLYIDFNGAPAMTWGTYNVPATPAYDTDNDPSSFSTIEIENMAAIWARVAEKFSPFNLDVTTVDPGNRTDKVTLAAVVGGDGAWLGALAGGVAYLGSFYNTAPNTVWVFPENLANGDPKPVAEAVAHEAGHGFGLEHQSRYSGTTKIEEYHSGDADRAPIMGNSYSAARGVWWFGPNAVSSSSFQDDLAVIGNTTNGFGRRADDHTDVWGNPATATPLDTAGGSLTGRGVIEDEADRDVFAFDTSGGRLELLADVVYFGPTLDLSLRLTDASGVMLALVDTATFSEGLSRVIPAGRYYVSVESNGVQGDVGQFTLSGTIRAAGGVHDGDLGRVGWVTGPGVRLNGIAGQPDGEIISVGYSIDRFGVQRSLLARRNEDGTPDTLFGPNGYRLLDFGADDQFRAAVVQHDFKIVAVGESAFGPTGDIIVARFNADGNLDTSFGVSGVATVDFTGTYDTAYGVALDPTTGAIVVAGVTTDAVSSKAAVIRLTASGVLDTTFDGDGRVAVDFFDRVDNAHDVEVIADGKVVIAGRSTPAGGINHFILARLNADGSFDTTFGGGDGRVTTNFGPSSYGAQLSVGPSGQYYVGGIVGRRFAVARYSGAGVLDTSWGGSGLVVVDGTYGEYAPLYGMEMQGSHVVFGGLHVYPDLSYGLGVARIDMMGRLDREFGAAGLVRRSYFAASDLTVGADYNIHVGGNNASNGDGAVALFLQDLDTYSDPRAFVSAPSNMPEGGSITVSGAHSHDAGDAGVLVRYEWDFNYTGGAFDVDATGVTPALSLPGVDNPVSRTIALRVTDERGRTNVATWVITVTNVTPTVNGGADRTASVNSPFTFSGTVADPGPDALTGTISWGDGSAAEPITINRAAGTFTTPGHAYTAAGTYTATLTVTDDDGANSTDTVVVTVNNASIAISGAAAINEGGTYTLNLSATAFTPTSWSINWGDGSAVQTVTGNPASVTHRYTDGTRELNVWATATSGTTTLTSNTLPLTVNNVIPTLTISGATAVNEGANYQVRLARTDPGTDTVSSWTVNWGDGTSATLAGNVTTANKVYPNGPAQYVITATVTDDDGTWQTNSLGSHPLTVDPAYGTQGLTPTVLGTGGDVSPAIRNSDGKYYMAARVNGVVTLRRYNTNGTLDTTFATGTGNVATVDVTPRTDYVTAIARQSDGKIVVAGWSDPVAPPDDADLFLARFTTTGALDTTFGSGGRLVLSTGDRDLINGIAVHTDNRIYAAGVYAGSGTLFRFTAAGAVDTTFGGGTGRLTFPGGYAFDQGSDVLVQADGKPVAVVEGGSLFRATTAGVADATFGSGGVAVAPGGAGSAILGTVARQADGKLLLAATVPDAGGYSDIVVTRFNATGTVDTTFGTNGTVQIGSPATVNEAYDIAVAGDGRIIVSGRSHGDALVARLTTAGVLNAVPGSTGFQPFNFGAGHEPATIAGIESDGRIVLSVYREDIGSNLTRVLPGGTGVTVNNVVPTVNGGADRATTAGTPVTISGSFTDPGVPDTHTATIDWGDGAGPQPLALGGNKTFSATHTYAADNRDYTVTIRVTDSNGGAGTDTVIVRTPPATPLNVAATAAGNNQINLSWANTANNENAYLVERSTDGVTFTQVAATAANTTTFNNTGLAHGTTYHYRVRARNAANQFSAYSPVASATTTAILPAAPTNLRFTARTATSVTLAWTDAATNETGFKLEQSTDGVTFTQVATPGANATTFNRAGLTAGVLYYFRVRATNTVGDSAYSNTLEVRTLPANPTGLAVTPLAGRQMRLTWAASAGETKYFVERSLNGSTWAQVGEVGQDVTTYTDTGLTAGTRYYYRVRAWNDGGFSAAYTGTVNAIALA